LIHRKFIVRRAARNGGAGVMHRNVRPASPCAVAMSASDMNSTTRGGAKCFSPTPQTTEIELMVGRDEIDRPAASALARYSPIEEHGGNCCVGWSSRVPDRSVPETCPPSSWDLSSRLQTHRCSEEKARTGELKQPGRPHRTWNEGVGEHVRTRFHTWAWKA
jgi:hypothetical protein